MPTIYLIHFDRPYKHARHYIGLTRIGVEQRLERHRSDSGAKLLKAVQAAGIKYDVVRTWEGDAALERRLKKRKDAPKLCPV